MSCFLFFCPVFLDQTTQERDVNMGVKMIFKGVHAFFFFTGALLHVLLVGRNTVHTFSQKFSQKVHSNEALLCLLWCVAGTWGCWYLTRERDHHEDDERYACWVVITGGRPLYITFHFVPKHEHNFTLQQYLYCSMKTVHVSGDRGTDWYSTTWAHPSVRPDKKHPREMRSKYVV